MIQYFIHNITFLASLVFLSVAVQASCDVQTVQFTISTKETHWSSRRGVSGQTSWSKQVNYLPLIYFVESFHNIQDSD